MHWLAVGKHVDQLEGVEYRQNIKNYDYSDVGEPVLVKRGYKNITFHDKINYTPSVIYQYNINL